MTKTVCECVCVCVSTHVVLILNYMLLGALIVTVHTRTHAQTKAALPEPRASQCAKMSAPAEPELNKRLMRLESHLRLEANETEPVEKRLMRLETFIKTTYEEEDEKKPVETVAEEEEEESEQK